MDGGAVGGSSRRERYSVPGTAPFRKTQRDFLSLYRTRILTNGVGGAYNEDLGAGMEFIVDFSEMFSGHMSVDLSGCDLAVTKHELNGPEIGSALQ